MYKEYAVIRIISYDLDDFVSPDWRSDLRSREISI